MCLLDVFNSGFNLTSFSCLDCIFAAIKFVSEIKFYNLAAYLLSKISPYLDVVFCLKAIIF